MAKHDKTNTYSQWKTDKKLEEEGAIVVLSDGSEWKLARANSRRSRAALAKAREPYKSQIKSAEIRGGELDEDISNKINVEWLARGVVMGWKDITDEHGEELPFSHANVTKILNDLPDLMMEVLRESGVMANFKVQVDAEAVKNSPSGSASN